MPNLISRVFSGISNLSIRTGNQPRSLSSFPINHADIETLKLQIQNLTLLRLDRNTLLSVAKSTIFESRKNALRLESMADLNSILEETDIVANLIFSEIGQHIPRLRHSLRLEYFRHLVSPRNTFLPEQFQLLQNHAGFPGHQQIQHELVRCQIEKDIESEYLLPPCRNTQRIARHNISNITQGEYAQHCLNIYKLSMPIDQEATQKMVKLCKDNHLPKEWTKKFENADQDKVPVHVLITDLLRSNIVRGANHNTHPAARLMEFSTGFIFHPNSSSNLNQLLNPHSPSAFQNVGKLLTSKYLDARANRQVKRFLEEAFVRQDPCYEATVENLIEFNPAPPPKGLTIPAQPKWTTLASVEENIEALLDWQEFVTLKNYVDQANIQITPTDHKKIDTLIGSTQFICFLQTNKKQIIQQLTPLIPRGASHKLQPQFDARWP